MYINHKRQVEPVFLNKFNVKCTTNKLSNWRTKLISIKFEYLHNVTQCLELSQFLFKVQYINILTGVEI